MSIVQEIEQQAINYMMATMRPPRFVLLDKKSRKEFDESFKAIMRYALPKPKKSGKVRKMATSAGWVDVLEVNTTKKLIEVVG